MHWPTHDPNGEEGREMKAAGLFHGQVVFLPIVSICLLVIAVSGLIHVQRQIYYNDIKEGSYGTNEMPPRLDKIRLISIGLVLASSCISLYAAVSFDVKIILNTVNSLSIISLFKL